MQGTVEMSLACCDAPTVVRMSLSIALYYFSVKSSYRRMLEILISPI